MLDRTLNWLLAGSSPWLVSESGLYSLLRLRSSTQRSCSQGRKPTSHASQQPVQSRRTCLLFALSYLVLYQVYATFYYSFFLPLCLSAQSALGQSRFLLLATRSDSSVGPMFGEHELVVLVTLALFPLSFYIYIYN